MSRSWTCRRVGGAYDEQTGINIDLDVVCAGYMKGRCGVCAGDSGGPLVQFTSDGRPVLVGITSRTYGCAWAGWPAIFTRISSFVGWLEEVGAEFEQAEGTEQIFAEEGRIASEGVVDLTWVFITAAAVLGVAVGLIVFWTTRPKTGTGDLEDGEDRRFGGWRVAGRSRGGGTRQ